MIPLPPARARITKTMRTRVESTFKYSAKPPHIPNIFTSVEDNFNLFAITHKFSPVPQMQNQLPRKYIREILTLYPVSQICRNEKSFNLIPPAAFHSRSAF